MANVCVILFRLLHAKITARLKGISEFEIRSNVDEHCQTYGSCSHIIMTDAGDFFLLKLITYLYAKFAVVKNYPSRCLKCCLQLYIVQASAYYTRVEPPNSCYMFDALVVICYRFFIQSILFKNNLF